MTFKISETKLADDTLRRPDNELQEYKDSPYIPFIIISLAILAFNFVILFIAIFTLSKSYDPYIHASAMFVSIATLACIAAIHRFILDK